MHVTISVLWLYICVCIQMQLIEGISNAFEHVGCILFGDLLLLLDEYIQVDTVD